MIWLAWVLRSMGCKHEFVYDERQKDIYQSARDPLPIARKTIVCATCSKCGWVRKYRKF